MSIATAITTQIQSSTLLEEQVHQEEDPQEEEEEPQEAADKEGAVMPTQLLNRKESPWAHYQQSLKEIT